MAEVSQTQDYELLTPMGLEEQYLKPEGRNGDRLAQYLALGAAATTLGITWIIVLSNNPFQFGWFALHPMLQSLAIAMLTFGILTLQPTNQPRTKKEGLFRHQTAILYLALPFITAGTSAVVYNKYIKNSGHFRTWHGTIGILCMGWILVQVALGGGSVWFDGAAFGGGIKAKRVWKYHRLSGYVLFPMLLLTVHLGGAWSHWGEKYSAYFFRLIAYTIAPSVIFLSIYARMRTSKMQFW